jgi:hypothetical protein
METLLIFACVGVSTFVNVLFLVNECGLYVLCGIAFCGVWLLFLGQAVCLTKIWFTPWTMKSDYGRWSFFLVRFQGQLSWSDFLKELFTKSLGPSLGGNQTWTKRSDHPPKSECAHFF